MSVRLAYLDLVGEDDPAREWLDGGVPDTRFVGGDALRGAVVRGPDDLRELHEIVDDLFGVGAFDRPPLGATDVRTASIPVSRPAAVMPLLEALRPSLEGRGPVFWTWKTAREAMALRIADLGLLTVQAALQQPA